VDGNHSTIYTFTDILAHPSVQLTRGGLILIGLLSGGDYHQAGLPRCGPGIAHGLAKSGLGDELLEAAQSLTRAELSEFLTSWREALRNELRTNSRKHLGSKKPSLAKTIPDSFPDIDILLSYTNPITSATDAGARRTHTPPEWNREPNLAKLAHVCELHFEWGLKDIIIKRFRTVLWPSIVLRALRRSALEADTKAVARSTSSPVRERESPRDAPGTPSKVLARHFSSMALEADSGEDDSSLGDFIVKIHGSRTHAYTDGLLEYRLEIAPAQLVYLASAGIQGLRKPADTTYDVLPSESEDSGEVDDEDGDAGTGRKKKRRGGGPPPEPESHLRVWMPGCMVRYVLPDLVDGYEAAIEAKRAKKSKPKVPRGTAKASVARGKRKPTLASRKTVQGPSRPADEEYFDLDVSSSGESDGRASPPPSVNHSRPLPTASSRDTPLPQLHPKKPNDAIVRAVDDVFTSYGMLPPTGVVRQHTHLTQDSPQRVLDTISVDDDDSDAARPSKTRTHHHLSSPSKVLQRLDQNLKILNVGIGLSSEARPPPIPPPAPSSSSLSPRSALRPFPMAFEEEESSGDDGRDVSSEHSTSNRQDQHIMQLAAAPATPPGASSPPRLPWPGGQLARKEEEEESSDDPDTVPAELPVFRPLSSPSSPRGQRLSRTSGNSQTTFNVLNHNQPSRQQQQQLQPSSSPSSPSKAARSSAREDDNELPPDHWRRQSRRRVSKRLSSSSSSIILISTDSDNASDNDDNSLPTLTEAPLLIARSRSAVSQRLATTSCVRHYRQGKNIEHEVIDLT
jgi:Holliday junction resolvase YEN1